MADLSGFTVAGFDDQSGEATEPVRITCTGCDSHSTWFTYRDDGGADRSASLASLVAWAEGHLRCGQPGSLKRCAGGGQS